ncbi:hypothetical protein [Williamsia sp. 1138]|uniref:hypothetical protein n=1 Tax=Williamsia sp. 1138 TaxID=1903117 RepID=UPI00143CC549|nr:hypothetical protein [Williamsia sp. 1138]
MSTPQEPIPHADVADELEQALPVTDTEDDDDYPHASQESDSPLIESPNEQG